MLQRKARVIDLLGRRRVMGMLVLLVGTMAWSSSSALAGQRLINFDDATDAPCYSWSTGR